MDRDPAEAAILDLLARRAPGKTICPSEAARLLDASEWRAHMQPVREAACHLADRGLIEITQRGQPVDGRTVTGPIRLRPANEPAANHTNANRKNRL